MPTSLKAKLASGGTVFGTMVFEFASPGLARIVASAGADFIMLDMEHSGWGFDTIKSQIAHAQGAGIAPIVGTPSQLKDYVGRSLDLGAIGVIVPHVETRAQAEALVRITRYPPGGTRGSAFGVAHDGYVVGDLRATMASADRDVMVIAKIESEAGVRNIDEILAVPGIDVAFVGHTDLSVSMGIPGQFDDARFVAARDAVAQACRRHAKTAGCLVANPEWGRAWMAAGYRMVAYLGDIWLFANALKSGLDAMRPK